LANEDLRETLIEVEHLGSALSDNVVSPVIRPCKLTKYYGRFVENLITALLACVAQPGVPDEPGFGSLE
jgi:hypothetical protein